MHVEDKNEFIDISEPPECFLEYLEDWGRTTSPQKEKFPSYRESDKHGKHLHSFSWSDESPHHAIGDCMPSLHSQDTELDTEFHALVKKWKKETSVFSSITKKVLHPSYQRIIGMGKLALPLILNELQQKPGHWFWALNAISGEDPALPDDDFNSAVEKWLEWGKSKGYLS